jgi:hypothetical protein
LRRLLKLGLAFWILRWATREVAARLAHRRAAP